MEKICKNCKQVFENRAGDCCSSYCSEQYCGKQSQILN